MQEELLLAAKESDFDFRAYAYEADPLKRLWPDWVPYYKLKWAIARILNPTSILEVGVRYGYSARAFLDACPNAQYVGIDADRASFGGIVGALGWAATSLADYRCTFLPLDSQTINRFPGKRYDLIHIDGQQDGDGTWNDLEKALFQAKYILVDGYLWSDENFAASNQFVKRFAKQIDWTLMIPGYAGELLIKVAAAVHADSEGSGTDDATVSSASIVDAYSRDYYLTDCGGYQQYLESQGTRLADARLQGMAFLAVPWLRRDRQINVLDIGCGRGELTYYFANKGAHVTAVDYSTAAAQVTTECVQNLPERLRANVEVICADINSIAFTKKFDIVTCSDVIEHLTANELDTMYERLSTHLTEDGILLLHTAPNLWNYQYDYPRERRRQLPIWTPPNPRSYYEKLMHINEQNPARMRHQLRRWFPSAEIWFGDYSDPVGSVARHYRICDMRAARSVWAACARNRAAIDTLMHHLKPAPLSADTVALISAEVLAHPLSVVSGEHFICHVALSYEGAASINAGGQNPLTLSYHWRDLAGRIVEHDGLRSHIGMALTLDSRVEIEMRALAPKLAGGYILEICLVQENVRWFDGDSRLAQIWISVATKTIAI